MLAQADPVAYDTVCLMINQHVIEKTILPVNKNINAGKGVQPGPMMSAELNPIKESSYINRAR